MRRHLLPTNAYRSGSPRHGRLPGPSTGSGFPYQQFPGHLNPDPTFFAWANKDLTAGWLVLWDILTDEEGNALLMVVANYQGAT